MEVAEVWSRNLDSSRRQHQAKDGREHLGRRCHRSEWNLCVGTTRMFLSAKEKVVGLSRFESQPIPSRVLWPWGGCPLSLSLFPRLSNGVISVSR
jgi:hypothetical protein